MKYNYFEAVKADVLNEMEYEFNVFDFSDSDVMYLDLMDVCADSDDVTGNASGSYTFNRYEAEEYLAHNFDLLSEAMRETLGGGYHEVLNFLDDPEACDVLIRFYLLPVVVQEVVDEYFLLEHPEKIDDLDDVQSYEVAAG